MPLTRTIIAFLSSINRLGQLCLLVMNIVCEVASSMLLSNCIELEVIPHPAQMSTIYIGCCLRRCQTSAIESALAGVTIPVAYTIEVNLWT